MASWKQILERLNSVDIEAETKTIVEDNPQPIVQLVQSQLIKGEDGNGKKLRRYKNNAYARKKNAMNPLPGLGVPDLRLTGDTYNAMGVDTDETRYSIVSLTPQFNYTILGTARMKLFGEDAVKLQEGNKNVYRREYLFPKLRQATQRKIYGM
jgi:hypothetical protein